MKQKKGDKLYYALFKSYLLIAVLTMVILIVCLFIVLDMDNKSIEINVLQLLLLLILIGACSLLYSRWMAKRVTGPLEELAAAIRRMGEGQYSERLHVKATYELGMIQERFNEMAQSLERAEEENHRLEESKQRMLADLSHDLKTPITTIQGYAKALELGLVGDEEKRAGYLKLIYSKATHVTELIDQIFQLTKLDRPDYPLVLQRVDLAELLREIAAEYYEPFESKAVQLDAENIPEEVWVECDPVLVRRAVSNLLSNALKHNPPGTLVTVCLLEGEQSNQIRIGDNGAEIPDKLQRVIFEPFVRGDASRREDGGSGLGLAIVRQIAELHRGELRLDIRKGEKVFELKLRNCGIRKT